ncbi:MAG: hypothetical protein JEZ03_17875 [Bacteroidales bacterium]|nr:hypothetical protein [Bacteroidales bacterium]
MCDSIEYKILQHFKRSKKGTIFLTDDFLQYGSAKAVSKALERLVNKEEVERIARGVFSRLATDPFIGKVRPSIENVAQAIAKRDKARIIPTGSMALNALGLSTQVPMRIVYLTDGSPRTLQVGKRTIKFKRVSPRSLSTKGAISSLVIQALKEIGKGNVTDSEKDKIIKHLHNEDVEKLKHDILLAPEWIRIIMRKVLVQE